MDAQTIALLPNEDRTREGLARVRNAKPLLQERAAACRALAQKLLVEADGLDLILTGLDKVEGEPATTTTTSTPSTNGNGQPEDHTTPPRGIAAVRLVIQGGGVWKAADIHAELKRRGWVSSELKNPKAATEAAIYRLWHDNREVERVAPGRYRYIGKPIANGSNGNRVATLMT
jgi:hypothetical protein